MFYLTDISNDQIAEDELDVEKLTPRFTGEGTRAKLDDVAWDYYGENGAYTSFFSLLFGVISNVDDCFIELLNNTTDILVIALV